MSKQPNDDDIIEGEYIDLTPKPPPAPIVPVDIMAPGLPIPPIAPRPIDG